MYALSVLYILMGIRYILIGILLIFGIRLLFGFFGYRWFFIVLLVLNANPILLFLSGLVIILVSEPWYVKVALFYFCCSVLFSLRLLIYV
jgi:hypothetical protein